MISFLKSIFPKKLISLSQIFNFVCIIFLLTAPYLSFARNNNSTHKMQQINQEVVKIAKDILTESNKFIIDFLQSDSNGKEAKGILLVEKPYKFRINYFPPFPLLIVGNKNYVSIYDYDMETINLVKRNEFFSHILSLDGNDFDREFLIEEAFRKNEKIIIRMECIKSGFLSEVIFNEESRYIEKIALIDGENITNIFFSNMEKINHFNDSLFSLKNPDFFGKPSRLSKKQIKKMLKKME